MLVFVLNQAQKANTGKIQTPVYENVREFGCEAEKGYYPDVRACPTGWTPIPAK